MRREDELRQANPKLPYRINIMVTFEVYERYRERLKLKGINVKGPNSKVMALNRAVLEVALEEMTDETLERIIMDVHGRKTWIEQ